MSDPSQGAVQAGADDHSAELKTLLAEFAADTPADALLGTYAFTDGDAWFERVLGARDGWYTHGGWSVRVAGGKAIEAQRLDLGAPPGAVKL